MIPNASCQFVLFTETQQAKETGSQSVDESMRKDRFGTETIPHSGHLLLSAQTDTCAGDVDEILKQTFRALDEDGDGG